MLRVTIELVPYGDEDHKKKIAEMVIVNAGRSPTDGFKYEAWTAADDWSGEPAMYGKLDEFDNRQSVWELMRLMLEIIRLEDNVPDEDVNSLAQRLKGRLL